MKILFKQRLQWLKQTLNWRIADATGIKNSDLLSPPDLQTNEDEDTFSALVQKARLSVEEQLVLMLGLSNYLDPAFFNEYILKRRDHPESVPSIGLSFHRSHFSGFIPTGETALFLLAGTNQGQRRDYSKYFGKGHKFAKNNLLKLEKAPSGEPALLGRLVINPVLADLLLTNQDIDTVSDHILAGWGLGSQINENDLILNEKTLLQYHEASKLIKAGNYSMFKPMVARKNHFSFKLLFHGPKGTGKSLAARLLARSIAIGFYRIDLSQIVSKYIGETEKNLSQVFEKAEDKDWVLFFDEADALFGKRSNVRESHDKYANQEVSYLMQRIESHKGAVILSASSIEGIDDALMRRFHHIIHFPEATAAERYKLWRKSLPPASLMEIPTEVELQSIASLFQLNANEIIMLSEKICLNCLKSNVSKITATDLIALIKNYLPKQSITN
jgi:hypothetical protein